MARAIPPTLKKPFTLNNFHFLEQILTIFLRILQVNKSQGVEFTPPPPELEQEVNPLMMKEAEPDIPEDPSPT